MNFVWSETMNRFINTKFGDNFNKPPVLTDFNLSIIIHPLVLFQIVDAYERRDADSRRVVGTIMGIVDKNTVEMTNSFCLPHKEYKEQVEVELSYALEMGDLNRRVYPKEHVVGWWATGTEVTKHSVSIHDYYCRECTFPIHLTVDTTLRGGRMNARAYLSVPIGVPGSAQGLWFTPVPTTIAFNDAENTAFRLLRRTIAITNPENPRLITPLFQLEQISDACIKMEKKLELLMKYVDDVLSRKRKPDNTIGRQLMCLINSVPILPAEKFLEMWNSNVRDMLMMITMSQMIKTQLQLTEKLVAMPSVHENLAI